MKKYVVLGVNDNPKYLYYLPLVIWAWRKFGWEPVVFKTKTDETAQQESINDLMAYYIPYDWDFENLHFIDVPDGYKSETIAQVVRLYAAAEIDKSYLMTTDSDMLPLSDYWFANIELIDCYGRDLTDYHYPICYIGMESYLWRKVMNIPDPILYQRTSIEKLLSRDLRYQKNMWTLDQDLITERLVKYQINRQDRGTDKRTGYPLGRVDRSNWRLDHSQLIDAHLPHDILTNDDSYKKVCELLHHVWLGEDFTWYREYHEEFKKLL